jgi:hypothetical protein
MAKGGSARGQIRMGEPLFIGGFDLLIAKADSSQILA